MVVAARVSGLEEAGEEPVLLEVGVITLTMGMNSAEDNLVIPVCPIEPLT